MNVREREREECGLQSGVTNKKWCNRNTHQESECKSVNNETDTQSRKHCICFDAAEWRENFSANGGINWDQASHPPNLLRHVW